MGRVLQGIGVMILVVMSLGVVVETKAQGEKTTIVINDEVLAEEVLPIEKGQLLVPIEEIARAMGATDVSWCENKNTLRVEIPFFLENRLYLSYLAGLDPRDKEAYPLPKKLKKLNLPMYPLQLEDTAMIHESPIGITITDGGLMMPWAAYDYEWIDGQLYVGTNWLNIMFLAEVKLYDNQLIIEYPTKEVIQDRLAKLQEATRVRTPEDAIALWIHGQQVRSGALQYTVLSPALQEEVTKKENGWVTGGSSPQVGKGKIVEKEQLEDDKIRYKIQLEEVYQGKVDRILEQDITLERYRHNHKTYWRIVDVTGDLEYSLL